jgi:hypothetical protein
MTNVPEGTRANAMPKLFTKTLSRPSAQPGAIRAKTIIIRVRQLAEHPKFVIISLIESSLPIALV